MASHRKITARPRPGVKKGGAKPKPAAKAATKPAAKPAAGKGAGAAKGGALNKGALAAKAVAAARAAALAQALGPKGKPKLAVAKRGPDPAVRPLGVLPPSARAKVIERPLPTVAGTTRSAVRPRSAGDPRGVAAPARPRGGERISAKDYKKYEQLLLEERQKIMKEMGHLEATVLKVNQRDSSGDLSGYSFHMADAGTDAMEREKAFLFASTEGRKLMEIVEALRRIHRGEYGVCEICGEPITAGRLEAVPWARLCINCQEKEERASRGAPPQ